MLVFVLASLTALGGHHWWNSRLSPIPAGIVWINGRIDAREIDIETKFAGRIAELLADEGDMVKAGQVLARIDTRDLEAKRHEALRWLCITRLCQSMRLNQNNKEHHRHLFETGTGTRR